MKKILLAIIFIFTISGNGFAASEGSEDLSKNNKPVNDCFEGLNRGIFAFNKALDDVIVEPLAKGYRKLPSPIRTGTSNVLDNLEI